jgi:hypothetical protein
MPDSPQELISLVYSSRASRSFRPDGLEALAARSRENNHRTGLTGLLLYSRGRFLQTLEGPEDALRERMTVITADPRHTHVQTLIEERIEQRRYPNWLMEYQPVPAKVADAIPGYRLFFNEIGADGAKADPPLEALQELLRWYRARATQAW